MNYYQKLSQPVVRAEMAHDWPPSAVADTAQTAGSPPLATVDNRARKILQGARM